jgi:hypothetical protein
MVKQRKGTKPSAPKKKDLGPPAPFKSPADVLQPLIDTLDEKHVYILHVDNKPASFKRQIFVVPVLMNVGLVALFIWRLYYILPWYLRLFTSTIGYANDTTMIAAELEWRGLLLEIGRRAAQFMLDFGLFMFVWPWPFEFALGQEHSNPISWRWSVGFREKEVIVRRSRKWDKTIPDMMTKDAAKMTFMTNVSAATAPMYLEEKTGYLTMNKDWDLDWGVMIDATTMVDKKMAAIEAFRLVVLVYQEEYGWISLDMKLGDDTVEDERRRRVLLFRDALASVGKDALFYRWIELIQFESTQPSGFGPERQEAVAQQVRDLFKKEGIDFDEFWKESVGTDTAAGL